MWGDPAISGNAVGNHISPMSLVAWNAHRGGVSEKRRLVMGSHALESTATRQVCLSRGEVGCDSKEEPVLFFHYQGDLISEVTGIRNGNWVSTSHLQSTGPQTVADRTTDDNDEKKCRLGRQKKKKMIGTIVAF